MNKRILLAETISNSGVLNFLPDKLYLKLLFWLYMKKRLNLESPLSFNEKLQWLKLYDRRKEYTKYVDKLLVREYVRNQIGEEYLIPLIGVWDSPDQIEWEKLPSKFVLKCNHDSHSIVFCKDRNHLDYCAINKHFKKHLGKNMYYVAREWPYKSVSPKILAEEYIVDSDATDELTDYKIYCFNGKAYCLMACYERNSNDTKFYFFDEKWQLLRINKRGKEAPDDFAMPKPCNLELMFSLAEKLSTGIPFVRVDLYESNNRVYFGELTLFPQGGFDPNYLPETDSMFGELIRLPDR